MNAEKEAMTDIPLPEAFVRRVGEQLGEELPSFLSAMEQAPVRGIRMNPFRKGGDEPFRDAGEKIPWARTGWELPADSRAGATIAHEAGSFYLQEPSAMIPAGVMDARPGEIILDLCAAPGGKATQMGLDMAGSGLLVCNEPVPRRAAVLSGNLERMGIPNSIVTCEYPEKLAARWPEGFDGILVDAPCSGEGMFRRDPETRREWTEEKAGGCAVRQKEILDSAARMVRPGGRIVYATCTWNPAENENRVKEFLAEHPEFVPEPFSLPGIQAPEGMFTCWLHRLRGEGQFAAKLRKRGEGRSRLPENSGLRRPDRQALNALRESRTGGPEPNALFGQTLIRAPLIPELSGIRVLRLGLHLGQVRGTNFFPDHAAAMSILPGDQTGTELQEEDALRFLAGEAISGNARGWTVLMMKGLPLGWGKGSGGMIRNHYPKGLRNARLIP